MKEKKFWTLLYQTFLRFNLHLIPSQMQFYSLLSLPDICVLSHFRRISLVWLYFDFTPYSDQTQTRRTTYIFLLSLVDEPSVYIWRIFYSFPHDAYPLVCCQYDYNGRKKLGYFLSLYFQNRQSPPTLRCLLQRIEALARRSKPVSVANITATAACVCDCLLRRKNW